MGDRNRNSGVSWFWVLILCACCYQCGQDHAKKKLQNAPPQLEAQEQNR